MNETPFSKSDAPAAPSTTPKKKGLPTWAWILIILLVMGPVGLVAMSIVAAVAIPKLLAARMEANEARIQHDTEAIILAIQSYVGIEGEYPGSLADLVRPDDSGAQYLNNDRVPKDPWGREYLYALPGEFAPEALVYTFGADGQPGGEVESEDLVFSVD